MKIKTSWQEESRKQFEEWIPAMVDGIPENMVKAFDEMLFTAWQASRAAIKIELPEIVWDITECGSQHYDVDDINDSIRTAGLTVKGDA